MFRHLFLIVVSAWLIQAASVLAQDIDRSEIAESYGHLISFVAEPTIASAHYTANSEDKEGGVSDADISTTKLPWYKEFTSQDHEWRWFTQIAVNYLTLDEKITLSLDAEDDERLDLEYKSYGGFVEGGFILPLGHGFSLMPSLGVGVSYLENQTDYSSQFLEEILEPDFEGVVFNWDTYTSVTRAHLGLRFDREYGNYRIKSSTHLSYNYIDSFHESSGFSPFDNHNITSTTKLDVSHPLNVSIKHYPLFMVGHLANTTFLGEGRDALGFTYFNEAGVSLGLGKIALGAMVIFGDDVDGWGMMFNYDY